jgi:sugar/nucleoside kinase (ribokinase family)
MNQMSSQNSYSPKVFISYSWDSNEHKARVLELSDRLRANGVDCNIDQYEIAPFQGWSRWMIDQIEWAEFVLVVCTEEYEQRFRGRGETGRGLGVRWEGAIITQTIYDDEARNTKFIPIVFSSQELNYIPNPLRSATRYVLATEDDYEDLYRHLTHQPRAEKPELGSLTPLEPKQAFPIPVQLDAFKKIVDIIKEQKNKEIDVITISANNYDHFLKVDKISPEHESVIISEFSGAGGSGANTVCGLSRLGKKTAIVGCVKDDNEGRKITESFNEFSVDSKLLIIEDDVVYSDTKTGNTLVLVERFSGRRQILVTPGINNYLSKILRANNEQKLNEVVAQVKKAKILHLTSFAGKPEMELQLSILEEIRDDNIIVSFTPGAIYVAEGLNQLSGILAGTNIMFLYTQQLNQLLERSREMNEIEEFKTDLSLERKIELFFEWRIKKHIIHPMIIVIKDYSQDKSNSVYQNHIYVASSFDTSTSFFCHQNQKFNVQNKTILPEDTTGTGDALAAGFLYGILEQKNIKTCADFGFIMSIYASRKLGARSSLLDEASLKAIVTENQPS